jgi:predicted ATPase/DNA-binding SARP family transcriptional activator
MNPQWRVELFGGLTLCRNEERITRFATQKTATLLAYLAFYRHKPHPREVLIEFLWPDSEPDAGRNRLSTLLSYLRHLLEPPGTQAGTVVVADRTTVHLNPDAVTTDVAEFERLLQNAARTEVGTKRLGLLQLAVSLYRDELLPGSYEAWIGSAQARLSERFTEALQELSLAYEQAGEIESALTTIERAVQTDPYREAAHRTKMRLQAALGRPDAVRESYRVLEQLFRQELGASLSATTRELAERLQRDPQAIVREQETPRPLALKASPAPTPACLPDTTGPSTLPLQMARFFGRTQEMAQLQHLFLETDTRLITILGPGGAGKTRMAIETAGRLAPALQNRVWFVALADLPDARLLSYALARALKLAVTDAADPLEAILSRLNEAPCLLVLDNFEHLLREEGHASKGDQIRLDTGSALVRLLLERAPKLRCLVTSRRALHLTGEQEYPLLPLPLPPLSAVPEEVLAASSVSLYVDRAKLARPDFGVTANNAEAVARLCRKLEGSPLALEMAAAWTKVLPPAKMLERLEERLDALTSRRRDLPARHQSLRATIDWSYDLLDAAQRCLLARLSVFRGGWSLEAAEAICADEVESENEPIATGDADCAILQEAGRQSVLEEGEILDLLTSLVEKSLVVSEEKEGEARYRLLEVVRQYGQERLQKNGEEAFLRRGHYDYFVEFMEAAPPQLHGSQQAVWLDQLEQEHDNCRAALEWSKTERDGQRGGTDSELRLIVALYPFWCQRGYWQEGRQRIEQALSTPNTAPSGRLRADALLGAGLLAIVMGDYVEARRCCELSLPLARQSGDRHLVGRVTMGLGNLDREVGELAAAQRWWEESLAIWRELENRRYITRILGNLSILYMSEGDLVQARRIQEECLAAARDMGDVTCMVTALNCLSRIEFLQDRYRQALAFLAECLPLLASQGDPRSLIFTLDHLASVLTSLGHLSVGVTLWSAIETLRAQLGQRPSQAEAEFQDSQLAQARVKLGEAAFETAWAQGSALSRERAVDYALEETRRAATDQV